MLGPMLLTTLFACQIIQNDEIPDQLEATNVSLASDSEDAEDEITLNGMLQVSGSERDFTLSLNDGETDHSIEIHTPGELDLSVLSGIEASATLSYMGLHGERSMAIQDESGPAFLSVVDHTDAVATHAMGANFATWGDTVATDSDSEYNWTYTTALFETDEGAVELLPGESDTITVDGASYQVAVVAAYKVEARPRAALPCGGIGDMLSYELIRVDAPSEAMQVERATGLEMAHSGCL